MEIVEARQCLADPIRIGDREEPSTLAVGRETYLERGVASVVCSAVVAGEDRPSDVAHPCSIYGVSAVAVLAIAFERETRISERKLPRIRWGRRLDRECVGPDTRLLATVDDHIPTGDGGRRADSDVGYNLVRVDVPCAVRSNLGRIGIPLQCPRGYSVRTESAPLDSDIERGVPRR